MSDSRSEPDALEKFLERILEVQERRSDEELGADELRGLAEKYGLDSDDYEKLVKDAEQHRTRGTLFFEHENWDDAIAELEQAHIILPYDNELTLMLGKAYARHWEKKGDTGEREKAEKLFRQCIQKDPHQEEAVRELTELENRSASKGAGPVLLTPVWWFAGLFLIGVGLWWFTGRPAHDVQEEVRETVPKTPEAKPKADKESGPVPIPASFPLADAGEKFSFESRSSVLTRYDGKYSYELLGIIKTGPVTIREMRARLELLGNDDTVFATHDFDILPSHQSAAIKGDSIPFRVLIFKEERAPEIAEARITQLLFDSSPFSGEIEPGKSLKLTEGKVSLPPNFGIEIRERNMIRSRGTVTGEGKAHLKLILTLRNTGNLPIESLAFRASVVDADGDLIPVAHSTVSKHFANRISADHVSAISSIGPPMIPGELRVVEASLYLPDTSPEDIEGYRLELKKIE